MATIKEVAKLAGVSVATVSRVLNHEETVRKETRIQVERAIKQLSYRPNLLGRNLRRLETRRIVVLLDNISNQFYSRVLKGIEDRARECGYSVMICTVRGSKDILLEHMKMLETRAADGAIVMCADKAVQELTEMSEYFPIVCACEPMPNGQVTSVSVDDYKASMDAVEHLISRGLKKIAVIGSPGESETTLLRTKGYLDAMKKNHLRINKDWIIKEGFTYNSGIRAVRKILSFKDLPEAVFAFSDSVAIGAIKEFKNNGIDVPKDVSVIGFDNTAMSEMYIPSITTVAQPQYEIGLKATELLINKINGDISAKSVLMQHNIICRDSVR